MGSYVGLSDTSEGLRVPEGAPVPLGPQADEAESHPKTPERKKRRLPSRSPPKSLAGKTHKFAVGRIVKWLGPDCQSSDRNHRAKKSKSAKIIELCCNNSCKIRMDDSSQERLVHEDELILARASRTQHTSTSNQYLLAAGTVDDLIWPSILRKEANVSTICDGRVERPHATAHWGFEFADEGEVTEACGFTAARGTSSAPPGDLAGSGSARKQNRRHQWSPEEEQRLLDAFNDLGPHWEQIRCSKDLMHLTGVQLKDKHRNLKKS